MQIQLLYVPASLSNDRRQQQRLRICSFQLYDVNHHSLRREVRRQMWEFPNARCVHQTIHFVAQTHATPEDHDQSGQHLPQIVLRVCSKVTALIRIK